ncbi:hypothetical protein PROFUN_04842 [Planoprotostelium fungivorum]|uniref:Uncharacterized protein n=1 Tax=Planoprotostelium fungivorum TaxID=1890364 RepID=A0A2P6NF06_9EUKA|nr:hypothetical protein PROFUN_04842 [Planoprotostelium fungivorum]
MTQWWSSAYNDIVSQLPQSIVDSLKLRIQNAKIRGKKCELNEESDNLKGLFEKELASYNNKKQCMKMNNKKRHTSEKVETALETRDNFFPPIQSTGSSMSNEVSYTNELQPRVNSPPPMDSGTPHHPSLPLSTCAQMSRRIAIVPQFTYISFATFFWVSPLDCRVQSYQLASNGLVAPNGVKLISE